MKRRFVRSCLGLALFAFISACASRKSSIAVPTDAEHREPARFIPSSPISGGDGSSLEAAVVITAPYEQAGVDLEYRWIFDHFGKFRKKSVGLLADQRKHFDEFSFELPDHSEHVVFFEISSFLGKSKPKD